MTNSDNWVQSAMTDTDLVVNLLFKLRHSTPTTTSSPPITWTIRQPRSTPPTGKKSPAPRASPTTPLSWSAATSEDSTPPLPDASRSKVIRSNETTPTKRPRKKKTLTELKEDETTLLKEKKQLKRQLARLQATCQKQREDNESLRKMKNDMKSQVLAKSKVNNCTEGKKNDGFVLPDLNIPVGDDY
ncbi:uncharacterized protein LOC143562733 [Bidens hawaiensis]|uniref:uncharacterized protein LOC143562733 n=1 Tax=Bidens hawaiensis TaxID=980011 RepID=UPI004049B7ED